MVVRIAPGQVRFVLPHLSVDARGVAIGRDLGFRFGTLERLVAFLRLVSAESRFDELGSELKIRFVRAPHGAREILFLVEQSAAHIVEPLARAARAAQGQGYTGAGRHFVVLRDAQSPLGYDVESLAGGAADLNLYGAAGSTPLSFEGELSLQQLLLRLELVRVNRGPEGLGSQKLPSLFYVTARQGLGPALVESLHHAGVKAAAALVNAPHRAGGTVLEPNLWLLRVELAPERLVGLFTHTPGLVSYLPVADNLAVAVGYRHPIYLDACRGLFPEDQLVLFAPPPDPPRVLTPLPSLTSIDNLVKIPTVRSATAVVIEPASSAPIALHTSLRLVQVPPRGEGPMATLVPWSQVPWVQRVGLGLPQPALTQYRMVALDSGLLVVAPDTLQWFPFGTLLVAAARGVLVPVGYRLRPAVSNALLEDRLGTADGSLVVFTGPDKEPFRVAGGDLVPLEKHVLGSLTVERARPRETLERTGSAAPPEIRYRPGLAMPLWGQR